jgi:LAO/AO transport system kinase
MVNEYRNHVTTSGYLKSRRQEQSRYWLYETIREGIFQQVFNDPEMKKELEAFEKDISEGRITSFMAAASILDQFRSGKRRTRT